MLENQFILKGEFIIEMECPVILESPDAIHLQTKNISSVVKSENLCHRKSCFVLSKQNKGKQNEL